MFRKTVIPGIAALALLGSALLSGCGGTAAALPAPCIPNFVYSKVTNLGPGFDVIDEEVHTNAGGAPQTFTFTSQHGGIVSIEESTINGYDVHAQVDQYGLEVDPESMTPLSSEAAHAVYDYVHQTDTSVQMESTLLVGSTATTTIPPGATGYALYGVIVDVTHGTLQQRSCAPMSGNGPQTVLLPISYYSCSWTRGPDEFTDGGQVPTVCGKVIAYDSDQ
jgi:hypothetical protein